MQTFELEILQACYETTIRHQELLPLLGSTLGVKQERSIVYLGVSQVSTTGTIAEYHVGLFFPRFGVRCEKHVRWKISSDRFWPLWKNRHIYGVGSPTIYYDFLL